MSNQHLKSLPTYTNEEVASILSRGIDRQHEGGRISHDELLETAREIGMTTLEIEASVQEEVRLRAERLDDEERQQRKLRAFLRHLVVYVVVGAFSVVIDTKLTGGFWCYWLLLAWGVGVALHASWAFGRERATPGIAAGAKPEEKRVEVRGNRMGLR